MWARSGKLCTQMNALLCPITNQRKGYLFEVPLPKGLTVAGIVLADHMKSMDRHARHTEISCQAPAATALEVIGKAQSLLAVCRYS